MKKMEFYDSVMRRVATRSFRRDPVNEEILMKILKTGTMAPSPENLQPWEFIVIKNDEIRKQLVEIKFESRKRILRGLHTEWSQDRIVEAASRNKTALETAAALVAVCFKNLDNPAEVGELRFSPCYAAAWSCITNIWLAATAEGLGLSPTFFPHDVYDRVKKILGLPDGYELAAVLRIGHPRKPLKPMKKTVVPLEKKLHVNSFGP